MEFSRQEYWSGVPFPSPGDLPDPGMEPRSPALQADALSSEPPGLLILYMVVSICHSQAPSTSHLPLSPLGIRTLLLYVCVSISAFQIGSSVPDSASIQFSSIHSVVSNSLRPHESQHARPPCPSPSPRVHSNSHPSSW